jgi:hypothetical protein
MTIPARNYELCVKQLASELGRHVNYVYAMKSKGFDGKSVPAALAWARRNGFVIVRGKPRLKTPQEGL